MLVELTNEALFELEVLLAVSPAGLAEVLDALSVEWRERMDREQGSVTAWGTDSCCLRKTHG